ncbi:MAG: pilus assembly protein MshO, partial [Deltaproteobacteria bacterium]|nr:pilus assembly protein MshO [Deltaproteobacteria bacterium]
GYLDLSRRTRLVDQAEMALRRMQRDVRQALPNSVRIAGAGQYLELLHTVDGGRYRAQDDPALPGDDILDFSVADNGFDVLGDLRAVPSVGQALVVYNISASGSSGNAYLSAADNVATVAAGSTVSHMVLSPAVSFANSSPFQRFFLVDGPVTFACENGVLNRYSGYAKTTTQATPPTGGTVALVTRGVGSCRFSYDPGASQRAGLITLELALTEAEETITLLHQVHVMNAP